MSYYPCSCSPCDGCSSTTPSCPSGTCLRVASLIIHSNNSILPCGSSTTVDIAASSDFTDCDGTISWYILTPAQGGYDSDAFTSVSISSAGVLSFTTTNVIQLNTFYTFIGKVVCSDGVLSQYFTVKFAVKNACLGIVCPEGEVCDPCDGTCGAAVDSELS